MAREKGQREEPEEGPTERGVPPFARAFRLGLMGFE
jgi:hypothetical protein